MPPRIARQSMPSTAPAGNRKKTAKSHKRALNAYATAAHTASDAPKMRAHRFGETQDDERGVKRRRHESDEEDGDEDDEEETGAAKRRKAREAGEDSDFGSDSSGNEWRLGGDIGEDSDSSLDSDEAFGSSDEERFEDYTFRGSSSKDSKKGKKTATKQARSRSDADMDLDEDDTALGRDEDEDDFGEEGVDLATMLDRSASESDGSGSEGDTESDAGDADSASSQSDAESEDGEEDGAKISRLEDLVASLEQPQRKSASESADVYESQQPSDFGVTAKQKLKISDLLPRVTDPTLRKSLKVLASDKPSKTSGIPGRLAAPLPKRAQNRLDRVAATEKAKEELDKWQDTVIRNRRADHLQFPLPDPNKSALPGETQLVSTTQDKPATELESTLQAIMEDSGLSGGKQNSEEEKLRAMEELQMNDIPVEEVLARRAALRRARDLLFREEIKAKRIAKIKSKSYRRVHRKEKERAVERERALFGVDEEEEKERLDRARAEQRMGLKHRESKFAKEAKRSGRTVWDDDAREGVVEMARRKEELRRRIEGKDVSGEESVDEEGDESDFEEGSDVESRRVERHLAGLEEVDAAPKKGIAAMAFMQRAEAAKKKANDATIEEMRREMVREGSEPEDDPEKDGDATIGRQVFGPKSKTGVRPERAPKTAKSALEEAEDSANDSDDDREAEIIVDGGKRPEVNKMNGAHSTSGAGSRNAYHKQSLRSMSTADHTSAIDDADEWLTAKVSGKKGSKVPQQDYVPAVNAKSAQKALQTTGAEPAKTKTMESSAPDTNGWTTVSARNEDDIDDSGEEVENPILTKAQEQEMYHARAFAGDDVGLAFDQEKTGQADEEDEKEESNYLPGWGSWAGDGLTKAARKQNNKQKHNPLFKTKVDGVRAADRRDAKLKDVIISEAQQKRGKKYLASQLPHEFEKKDQYERSMRIPIGPEWTTKDTFQRNTKPRVIVKQGIIAPMKRPLY